MAELGPEIVDHFGRHLVTLECRYIVLHQNKPHEEVRNYYSGFVLYQSGAYVWVTAGHCLAEIDDILSQPTYFSDVRFQFVDTLHDARVCDYPVPFDYVNEPFKCHYWHRDEGGNELGHDYGVIFLRSHYSRLLDSNGIVPVGEENWRQVPDSFDVYYMIGLPCERITKDNDGLSVVRPSMFSVTRLNEKPEQFSEHTDPMLYARIDPASNVGHIKGMSGGPVMGFKNLGPSQSRYWFVAIQSGWYESKRVICASPLDYLAKTVTDVVEMFSSSDTSCNRHEKL